MLLDTVDLLLRERRERIAIEVATENRRTLGLYESCGFRLVASYGHYELPTTAH
jgi:ribosomal protein S18 acetylase RimI-like enzyme